MLLPFAKKFGPVALLIAAIVLPASAATVTGTVKYEGAVPKLRPIRMDADPGCAKKHSTPAMPDFLVMGEGNTLGNIFVQVKSGLAAKTYPTPSEPVEMNQNGCQYQPHVMGVMVGQTFRVLNSDGLLHNVHSLPKVNRPFNKAMPANVKTADYTFDKPEATFKVKCDVHPWMGAFITVMDHPFFDVTGTDGAFEIKDLPAGTYEIEIWHEKLGTQTQSVTVADSGSQSVDFSMSPPKR
jgi:plastocyanin